MNNAVQIDETQAYVEAKNLIRWWARKFHHLHKGDLHEYIGEGDLAFVRAIRTYDPARRPFVVYLHTCVWRSFMNLARNRHIEAQPESVQEVKDRRENQIESLMLDLSEDTQTVLSLLFERTQAPRSAWKKVRMFLLSVGWSAGRVSESFREIEEALTP